MMQASDSQPNGPQHGSPDSEGSAVANALEPLSADWLDLRRDADARARTESTRALAYALARPGRHSTRRPLDVIDLGAGSGSNALYLIPELARAGLLRQRWILVDQDRALLDQALVDIQEETQRAEEALELSLDIEVEALPLNLATEMDDVPLSGAEVVTGSALLALASPDWLKDLASRLEHYHVPIAHFTMTVDGHVRWSPSEAYDEEVTAAFHDHMRVDRGFGPAAGPDAVMTMGRALASRGATVQCFDASWILDDLDTEMQERYLERVSQALTHSGLDQERLQDWIERRRRWIDLDDSELIVGHNDLLAIRRS